MDVGLEMWGIHFERQWWKLKKSWHPRWWKNDEVAQTIKKMRKSWKINQRHGSILHDWWPVLRGYDTMRTVQTTGSPARSAGTDACRSFGFIGGGQTFKFFFDAPPRKPLLWGCLLAWASRDLYPVRLWFARALIPHPICSGRDTAFQDAQIEIWQSFHSQNIFCVSPPTFSVHPLHFIPIHPPPLSPHL